MNLNEQIEKAYRCGYCDQLYCDQLNEGGTWPRHAIRAYMLWRNSQQFGPGDSLPSDWTPFGGVPKPMPKPSFPSGGGDFMPFEQPSQRGQVPDWWRMRRRK